MSLFHKHEWELQGRYWYYREILESTDMICFIKVYKCKCGKTKEEWYDTIRKDMSLREQYMFEQEMESKGILRSYMK